MPIAPDATVAARYRLVECLGAGGMGEVWRALDNKFTRDVSVAIKFLKEDETFAEDARNRSTLARQLAKEAASGHLTFDFVVNLLVEAFNCDLQRDALVAAAELRFAGREVGTEPALELFDQLVNDSTFNDNARHRKRLRDMFATEANSVAVLQHPNLVRVTDYGEHEGSPFLVMDFINGNSLQQVIQRRLTIPLVRRLRLIEDLCEGLAYAHAKDLVHRDIKPANLIIDAESDRLKILDFGVVRQRQVGQRTASIGLPIGTFCYMSPEQTRASRTLDHRSDIFAVGLVFYELLSYQRAFPSAGDVGELIGRIQRDPPTPLRELIPDLDPEIEAIVYKAIEKVPARRFSDLTEMRRQIEPIAQRLEEEERRRGRRQQGSDTVVERPKSLAQQLAELTDNATTAFDSGNDSMALELCQQILLLAPEDPDALALKDRAATRREAKVIESLILSARRELNDGHLTAAGLVLERPEIDPRHPLVRGFIEDLEAGRRARRVDSLIQDARMFLATDAPDAAIERAQAALELDASSHEAARMLERARAQQRARRQRAVDAALAEAEGAVIDGRLPDAIRTLSPFTGEPAVDAMLGTLLPKHDEQLARQRTLNEGVTRAQALIDSGDFKRAFDLVVQTGALDRRFQPLVDLRRQLEPIVRAIAQLDEAVTLFDQDEADEAEQQLGDAAEILAPHLSAHPSLRTRLDDVAAARHAAVERERAEERRAAAEAEERRRRAERAEEEEQERILAEAAQRVRDALAADAIDRAERELARLAALPQSEDAAAELSDELAAARQRARDAAAVRQVEIARQLVDRDDLEGAAAILRAFSAPHPSIDEELNAIELAIRQREGDRARAAETDRLRREIERRVDEALASADARFGAGERDAAIALLNTFQPRHPRIEERHVALVKEHARLQAAERAEMQRSRLETERAQAEAKRREWLDRATAAAGQEEFGTALALLEERLAEDAGDVEARQLFERTLDDLRAAAAARPTDQRLREAVRQYAPPPRPSTSRRTVVAAALAALVVAVAGGAWLMQRPPEPAAATTGAAVTPIDSQNATAPVPAPTTATAAPTTPPVAPPTPLPAPPPETATLSVNLRPWARVQLRPTNAEGREAPEAQVTPFVINLPAGEYVLQADNSGLTQPLRLTLRLEGGKVRVVAQDMPGFNADRVLDALLGQAR